MRCSRALLHNLQLTSDRCLIFASHLATRMIPAIAIFSRLLCLQGTRGSFKYLQDALLSFCHNINSAVHVPYAGLSHTRFQEFSVINQSVLLQDLDHALRVEFLLKTDSEYPKDAEVTLLTLANPGSSLRFNTHWSAPPVSALARSGGPRKMSQSSVSRNSNIERRMDRPRAVVGVNRGVA